MIQPEITSRHRSIFKRSFERQMDLFLTTHFLRSGHLAKVIPEAYRAFKPTRDHWVSYLRSHQAKSFTTSVGGYTVGDLDVAIKAWWTTNKGLLDAYQAVHQELERCISLVEFNSLLAKASDQLACAYCHITEAEFKQLLEAGQMQTKRLRTRGITFELDCRVPERGYAADNVVVCCYWCNNAKSDEFSPEEFQPVAEALEQVWRGRLATCAV